MSAARAWFSDAETGGPTAPGRRHRAMTLSDGPFHRRVFALPTGQLPGLTRHDSVDPSQTFSASTPGMDHVGSGVADRVEIEQWRDHLDSIGVRHSGVVEADYGLALSFKDPDGNALEFFHPAS